MYVNVEGDRNTGYNINTQCNIVRILFFDVCLLMQYFSMELIIINVLIFSSVSIISFVSICRCFSALILCCTNVSSFTIWSTSVRETCRFVKFGFSEFYVD